MKIKSVIIPALGVLMLGTPLQAAETADAKPVIQWAGCGISKKAFMSEMAKAYEKKTGIKINLSGGGATKGIRKAAAGQIDIGGACRVSLENHKQERDAHQVPVAWDALVVIAHKDNPVKNIKFDQIRGIYLGKIKNWKIEDTYSML
jgi:phosphate transport system substrate-binding protein